MSVEEANHATCVDKGLRQREMKVLVMGLGRTGTTALAAALRQLGFAPYDYTDRFLHNHSRLWDDAMRAKFQGVGKPWGRQEFDRLTSNFDVTSSVKIDNSAILTLFQCILDVPCCFFVEDLCEAYPEAKVILNTRDVDDWFNSMQQTLFRVFRWPSLKILRYTDPGHCGAWCDHNDLIWSHFCDLDYDDKDKCKRRFLQHNEHVRQVVSRERLLQYNIKQGWKPITAFLGLPEFTGTVERNNAYEFVQLHTKLWRLVMINTVGKASLILSAGVGILAYSISRSA